VQWQLSHGAAYRSFSAAGIKYPYEPPKFIPENESLLDAFWELSTERAIGFGVGPIPASAIQRIAPLYHASDPDQFFDFRDMIRAMDGVYLDYARKAADNPDDSTVAETAMTTELFDRVMGQ
jgi:hypothetical protein